MADEQTRTTIREMDDADPGTVVELWIACGISRPCNHPSMQIAFARYSSRCRVLVALKDPMVGTASV